MNVITSWDDVPLFDSEEGEAAFWAENRLDLRLMDSAVAASSELLPKREAIRSATIAAAISSVTGDRPSQSCSAAALRGM